MEFTDFLEKITTFEDSTELLEYIATKMETKEVKLTIKEVLTALAYAATYNRKEANRTAKFLEIAEQAILKG